MEHLFKNPALQSQLEGLLKSTSIEWSKADNGAICVQEFYEEAFSSLVDAVRAMVFPSPTVLFLDTEKYANYKTLFREQDIPFEEEVVSGRPSLFFPAELDLSGPVRSRH